MNEPGHRDAALAELSEAWKARPDMEGTLFAYRCDAAIVHGLLAVAEQLSAIAARMPQ
jgi:hypothetical protein